MGQVISLNGQPVIGFGDPPVPSECACKKVLGLSQAAIIAPTIAAHSPWAVALVTSMVGAATGWLIEEAATHARRRRRR